MNGSALVQPLRAVALLFVMSVVGLGTAQQMIGSCPVLPANNI